MTNRITWLGHSGWRIDTSRGVVGFVDVWLNGNPVAAAKVADLPKASFFLITHDHGDHAGDAVAIAQQTGATLVGQPETVKRYQAAGAASAIGMNIGGTIEIEGVRITMIDATHSSETGTPAGYIVEFEDGKTLCHAGDTGPHASMAMWGDLFDIDVALLPIGDHYTMGGRLASRALKMLKAKTALPMHYRTFPLLAQSADDFVAHAKTDAPGAEVRVIEIGGTYEF
jgi:L-ascorbate metabolism protein UlaG (beta-lactamase superfamily)